MNQDNNCYFSRVMKFLSQSLIYMRLFKLVVTVICPLFLFAQDFSKQWKGHYSYFKITDVYATEDKVYAAAENSVFIYDNVSKATQTISTVNGLSGETISTIYHSKNYNITAIGYENGLLEFLTDDNSVRTFVDIPNKPTIAPNEKRINHFFEYQDKLFVSTDFGIVEFNLERVEFGNTFFIGTGGSQIVVNAVNVLGDKIYAATDANGVFSANVSNPNLVDFNQWSVDVTGGFSGINSFGNRLIVSEGATIRTLEQGVLNTVITAPSAIKDFSVNNTSLGITLNNQTLIYNTNFEETGNIISTEEFTFGLNTSTISSSQVYLGTNKSGLIQYELNDLTNGIAISPDGPLLNTPFSIDAKNERLWIAYGNHDLFFNPFPLESIGVSGLVNDEWVNIPYEQGVIPQSMCSVTINPNDIDQVFFCSFHEGLLEIKNNEVVTVYNSSNAGFVSLDDDQEAMRLNSAKFDQNGDMWLTSSIMDESLNRFSLEDKSVLKVSLGSLIPNPFSNLGFGDLEIGDQGNIYVTSYNEGIIAYNTTTNRLQQLKGGQSGSNLPSNYTTAVAIDRNNQLWIGTFNGLRVVFNASSIFDQNNPIANEIIVLDDENVAQELLFGQTINDIEVDGSNNKWIATASSGVFQLSPNGQETLNQFNTDNSPLPSNNVLDVSIDDSTGAVFMATEKGLLEFKGIATEPEENLENLAAFPNPVRPNFDGNVTITGLSSKSNVKITDIEGNLVYETISDGGSVQWDTTAFGRHKVASGVYLIITTGEDQTDTNVTKLLIVR